ncbi:MAG: sulfatase, partial [Planctomycetota bacterium]
MKRFHSYLAFVLLLTCCATGFSGVASTATAADRPNIVWLTSEDNGPHLGCYGDDYATTPNLDALAAKGLRYKRCWSNAPVCAPARTTILTGMYPPSIGGQHMRSGVALPPDGQGTYPWLLKRDGYYCTNNSKTDYNLFGRGADTKVIWDESGNKAHWQKRPNDDTPFFAIFNFTISHESKLRTRPHKQVHDPAGVRVPAYHPDVPEVRQDWAQYYDKLTEMDSQVGRRLRELEDAGLMDDTIIFYYGDHGSGMPRNKRWPYNTGLHVPLIVYVPEKFKDLAPADYMPGGVSDQLVAFVDLGPTVL